MYAALSKILKEDQVKDYGFPVTCVTPDNETLSFNVFTDSQFRLVCRQLFGARLFNDFDDESTLSECVTEFKAAFDAWRLMRADSYGRRMYALSIKFEPLENYRSHEERSGSFTHGESVETSFDGRKDITKDDSTIERTYTNFKSTEKDDSYVEHSFDQYKETIKDDSSVERTYSAYKESMNNAQQTIEHKISADDSAVYSPQSQDINGQHTDEKTTSGSFKDQNGYTNGNVKTVDGSWKDQHGYDTDGRTVEQTGSYKDTKGFTNGNVYEKTGKETIAHTGTDQDGYTLDRFGNIGVTTSQQMLASDLDLLKYDIAMYAIKEFISAYTYMSCEVD